MNPIILRAMQQSFFAAMFLALLLSVQACSQQTGALAIVKYGPHDIKANVPFNVQKNGQSALWFRLNRDTEGEVYVVINGTRLDAVHHSSLVTVSIPTSTFGKPGSYSIYILELNGSKMIKSSQINLEVF